MKHLYFILLAAAVAMTTACSTTEVSESDDDSAPMEESTAAPAATVETTESQAPAEIADEDSEPAAEPAESQTSKSTSSSDGSEITYVCTHDGSVRTIKVIYPTEGDNVCEVTYEKSTGTQTLWNAKNDKSYCEDKAIEFVTKQEGWGWQCNTQ